MIYASFNKVLVTRNYKNFCDHMKIPTGTNSRKWGTPAENRMVAQFLLAVNTGRRAVFINFNEDLAVVVEPFFPKTRAGRLLEKSKKSLSQLMEEWTCVKNYQIGAASDKLAAPIWEMLNKGSSD